MERNICELCGGFIRESSFKMRESLVEHLEGTCKCGQNPEWAENSRQPSERPSEESDSEGLASARDKMKMDADILLEPAMQAKVRRIMGRPAVIIARARESGNRRKFTPEEIELMTYISDHFEGKRLTGFAIACGSSCGYFSRAYCDNCGAPIFLGVMSDDPNSDALVMAKSATCQHPRVFLK